MTIVRSSLPDRILSIAVMLAIAAWGSAWAVRTFLDVLPVLLGITAVAVVLIVAWRRYRERSSGW